MSKNNQNIIKRINDINTELGLTNSPPVGGGSVSLRDLSERIIQKLTSTSSSDINGKVLDIFNKIQTIYNWSSDTNSKVNSMVDTITQKLSDVAKQSTVADIHNKTNSIYNETTSGSTSYMNGQVQWLYNNFNGIVKSVQRGVAYEGEAIQHYRTYKVNIATVNPNKSFLLIGDNTADSGEENLFWHQMLYSTYFEVGLVRVLFMRCNFSWQVIEFY